MNTPAPTQPKALEMRIDNVRLSYPQLFQAKAMEGSKPKFSAVFLLNKKQHAKEIAALEKMIDRAMLDKFGKKVTLKHVPLHDGNEKEDKEGYGDEVMYLTSKSDSRPAVVDQKKAPLTEADGKIYGGCYVNAFVQIFAYKHPTGGMGVACGLKAVQFFRDGESFGAGPVDTDKVFDTVGSEDDASNY